jgi:hypothetical protein
MQLLPNEETLVTSESERLILTTRRIRLKDKQWGRSHTVIIFLEDISSIENLYKSNILFLALAACGLFAGVLFFNDGSNTEIRNGGFIAGILFLLLWLNSRTHVVTISSNGGAKLNFVVEAMGESDVEEFLYNVSLAKAKRVEDLI